MAIALTISMLAAPVGAVHAAPLVSDGRAGGCIVVPKSSQQGRVLTAAKDLADYIKKMSDASIPIRRDSESCAGFRVLIGNTRLAPVEPAEVSAEKVGFDGFVIRTVPDGVVIAGRTPQGTANGVYHFAENVLDVHWFSLEDDGPTCPKRQTIEIPELNLTVKPDFQWRGQYYQGILKYLPEQQKANQNRWWTFNRLWGEDAVEVYHALVGIVPNSLYDKHPEYFPLVNGKRLRGDTNPDSSEVQRCLSNPDVQKMAAESTAQYFNKNPGCRFASLSANDAGGPQGGFCECDSCKALGPTPSHQILAFGNAVAKANEARYPDRGYAFLAYRHTLNPPLDMKAHRNLLPVIAPLDNCRIHSIHSRCQDVLSFRQACLGWKQLAGRIGYYLYNNGGAFTGPGVITMSEELKFLRDCGGIGGFREHNGAPQANWAMLNWVEIKLMWDVDQDVVALRKQFIKGYYGPAAAGPVDRIYSRIESGLRASSIAPRPDIPYGHNLVSSTTLKPFVAKCEKDFKAAFKAVQSGPEVFRVRVQRDLNAMLGK